MAQNGWKGRRDFVAGFVVAVLLLSLIVPPLLIDQGVLLYCTVLSAPCAGLTSLVLWLRRARQLGGSSSPWFALFFLFFGYVVLGMAFALAYKAATGLGSQLVSGGQCVNDLPSLLYFSLCTATTLALGDFTPGSCSTLHRFLICAQVAESWLFFALAVFFLQESVKTGRTTRQCPLFASP